MDAKHGSVAEIDKIVRAMATVAVENEKYFGDLDAVVGDGDFGYSLARGFEVVLKDLDSYDASTPAAHLKKIASTVISKVGGTSGPLWGTAFLRAAGVAGDKTELTAHDAVAMLRAGALGIGERGRSGVGDKTLLDALLPATDALGAALDAGDAVPHALARAADVAESSAEQTKTMLAKRGRASYSGERSIGSVDAGAVAVGHMFRAVSDAYAREGNRS